MTFRVNQPDGSVALCTTLAEVTELQADHGTLAVTPQVHFTPCREHRGYQVGNCPVCAVPID